MKKWAATTAKVEKKRRQEANVEKVRQAAQSTELKKAFQVSLQLTDWKDNTWMSEVSKASAKHKHANTIMAWTTFSGVSTVLYFCKFLLAILCRETSANGASVRMPLVFICSGISGASGVTIDRKSVV